MYKIESTQDLRKFIAKYFAATFAVLISFILGANLLGAYEIPTTPAGTWTAVGVTTGTIAGGTAAETGTYYKTTPSGLRLTVTVNGAFPNGTSGAYFNSPANTSTAGLNPTAAGTSPGAFTTTPVLPASTNPLNLLVSANPCQASVPAALSCTGLGTVLVTLTDPTGGAVPVVAPKMHVSRLGGTVGSMELATGLQINAGASSPGIGFAATAAATGTLTVQGGNEFFGNPNAGTVNLNVNCGASATSSAGCGTVQVTGNAATIQMNVNAYRTNVAPNAWTNGADAFFFDMTFDEDFGGAPASYDAATAAGHLVTDLRLGSTVSVENPLVVNGTATGTSLIASSPNAVVAPAVAGDTNDGLVAFPLLTTANIGSTYTVTPTLSGASRAGKICGWVDFDRSGTFTAAEGVCNNFASGATSSPLVWTVPVATTAGPTYARVRVSYDTNMSTASFNGLFSSGEVEDYLVQIKPTVKVVKSLVPVADAGTFNLSINGTNFATAISNNGTTGFKTVYNTDSPDVTVSTDVSAAPISGVVLTETGAGATNLSNYVTTSACINAAGTAVTVGGTALAPSVTIPQSVVGASANGQAQSITCTLTNTAKPKLTLVKTVTNDTGGTNVVADFTLAAAGPTPITGLSGASSVTNAIVNAGTYTLTESGAALTNYIAGAWSCTAGTLTGNSLVLANNQNATCTINNNDKPKLTLVKSVVNTGGGVATTANFPLTATGPSTITGLSGAPAVTSATVDIGTFALSETPLASYTAGAWSCSAGTVAGSNVTLTASNNATCTITNTFVPAPALSTAKSGAINAGGDGVINAGDVVTFTYTVQNTGNVSLTNVAPTDVGPKFNAVAGTNALSAFSPATATVAPGATQTFTATYTLSQTDVNNSAGITNGMSNTAKSTGTPPTGAPVNSANSTYTTTIPLVGTLTTAKSAAAPTVNLGAVTTATDGLDTITYSYTVTNTGNVTMTNVAPTDGGPKFNGALGTGTLGAYTPASATLAPGGSQVFTATYTLTQADVNNGAGFTNGVTNTATASGKLPNGTVATSPSSSASTTISKASSIATVKSAGSPTVASGAINSLVDGGDTITYSYSVKNTGNVTLTNVAPADAGPTFNGTAGTGTLAAFAPTTANIAPGATQVFTATYTLTQGDVNNAAGITNAVANSATASGKQPDGSITTSPSSNATTTINKTSTLAVTKSAGAPTTLLGAVTTGTDGLDTITYTYTVKNTGNVTLTSAVPTDAGPKFNGVAGTGSLGVYSPTTATILPGATATFNAVYTLSQADVNNGAGITNGVTNSASASGLQPSGTVTTSPNATATTTINSTPSLTTTKSASAPTVSLGAVTGSTDALDTITFSYVVANTGNLTLTNVVPTDAGPKFNGVNGTNVLGAFSPTSAAIAPGASQTFTATYVLSQTDVDNAAGLVKAVTNTATSSGKLPDGTVLTSASSSATATINKTSTLATVKSAASPTTSAGAVATATDANDTIAYTYTVKNTGNVTLSNVVPNDAGPKFNGVAGTGSLGVYAPASATIAPGASQVFTATYTLTQGDVNNGAGVINGVTNTASASGKQPDGSTTTSPTSDATTTINKTSTLATVKSASTPTFSFGALNSVTDGLDRITYTYSVTNTGNVTLTNVAPTDAGPQFNAVAGTNALSAFTPASATVAPGATQTFTATYILSQTDVNNAAGVTNGVTNSATSSGKQPGGTTTTSPTSTANATINKTSALTTVKSAASPTVNLGAIAAATDANDTITYTYTVTNTGNVTLTTVQPTDAGPKFNGVAGTGILGAYSPASATLAPGAAQVFTAAYTLTQADVDAAAGLGNIVTNTATSTGKQPDGTTTTSPASSASTAIAKSSTLQVVKSAASPTVANGTLPSATDAGDKITYSYSVTNTGNVSLTAVAPTDAGPTFNGIAASNALSAFAPLTANLAPGATQVFTATYTLSVVDVNNAAGIASGVTNTATAAGKQPDGSNTVAPSSSAATTILEASSITTAKTAGTPTVSFGASTTTTDGLDTITYTYIVKNTGNVALTNVKPIDAGPTFNGVAKSGTLSAFTPLSATLAPNDTQTFTAIYTLSQGDVNNAAGVLDSVANTATSTGTQPDGGTTTSPSSSATANITKVSTLATVKSAAAATTANGAIATATDAGDIITYTYAVTNIGNVSLFSVAPIDAGPQFNAIAGTGTLSGYSPATATLLPGATQNFTATYTLTQVDVNNVAGVLNGVTNTATSAGTQPDGSTTTSPVANATTTINKISTLTVGKAAASPTTALGSSATQVGSGDTITYTYTVQNTGNVTLTGVVPVDAGPTFNAVAKAGTMGAFSPASATLAPNATQVFTAVYTLAQSDVNNGAGVLNGVSNTTTAHGTQPGGGTTTAASSTATTTIPEDSSITLAKSAASPTVSLGSTNSATDAGDTITYTYTVKNTGNVTVTNATPSDVGPTFNSITGTGTLSAFTPTPATLAPGASAIFTATYTLTQADVNNAAGLLNAVSNTASATAVKPAGGIVTAPTATATTTITKISSLSVGKSASAPTTTAGALATSTDALDTITYTYTVKNTGNVTLTNVLPVDTGPTFNAVAGTGSLSSFTPASASLLPNDTQVFTATYTLSQVDVDNAAGISNAVSNTATSTGTQPGGGTTTSPAATAKTTIAGGASLAVTKIADKASVTALPTTITYTINLTNTGNTILTGVALTDALTQGRALTLTSGPILVSGDSNSNSKIDLTEVWSYSASYAVTQANFDSGVDIVNTATVSTTQTAPQTATATTTISQTALMTTTKSVASITTANGANTTQIDGLDVITYNYILKNEGNITLTNAVPTDAGPKFNGVNGTNSLSAITPASATILPGATQLFTSTYTLSQIDVNNAAGLTNAVQNTAVSSAKKPDGSIVTTNNSTASTTIPNASAIDLAKSGVLNAGANGRADAGDTISYTFNITNTGNTTLTGITITDPVLGVGVSGGPITLVPGASNNTSITAVYILTQADIDGGVFNNTATVNGKDPRGATVSKTASASVPLTAAPALTIDKTTASTSTSAAGESIVYSYLVTNSGNTTVTSAITVSDDKVNGAGGTVSCPALTGGILAPLDSITCTATYVVTQADIDGGGVTNIAAAHNGATTSPNDSVLVPSLKIPKLTMIKKAVLTNFTRVGDLISYEYYVTNEGNTTIVDPITVTDNFLTPAPGVNCPSLPLGGLLPGDTLTCTADYRVTQDDLDIGSIVNIATATDGTTLTAPASETVPALVNPALALVKSVSTSTFTAVGEIITYKYDIKNTGNVTLTKGIEVVDDQIGTFMCIPINFAPGDNSGCKHDYTISQADMDRGFVTNNAYAQTIYGSLSTPVTSPPDTQTVTTTPNPHVKITKLVAPAAASAVGDILTYTFKVENDGNTTLRNITVSDLLIPSLACAIPDLAPTITDATCTGTYTVTQADVDAGTVVNKAFVNAVSPLGTPVDNADTLVTPMPAAAPAIEITKTPSLASFSAPGEVIGYVFKVKNTGNVTLTGVSVTDPLIPSLTCSGITLAPGASNSTCSGTYTTVLADVNGGHVFNTATATGTDPLRTPVSSIGTADVTALQTPALQLTKIGTPLFGADGRPDVGDKITYTFTVKNTGNVTLTNVSVSDGIVAVSGASITLLPGASNTTQFTGSYTLTQADIDAGTRPNTATVSGYPPNLDVVTATASITTPLAADPKLAITKTGVVNDVNLNLVVDLGDTITYAFTVTNTGNVTLTNVLVTDPLVAVSGAAIATLAPGGVNSSQFSATYSLTQADIDNGSRINTATVAGKPPVGANVTATDTVNKTLANLPSLSLSKSGTLNDGGDGHADVGDTITYAFTVKNTGNVTLTNVVVTDPKVTLAGGPILTLAPGASDTTTFTANYVLTQTDINFGKVLNTAFVSGKPPFGANVTSQGSADTTIPAIPSITLVKNSILNDGGDGVANVGDTITYSFIVTNTGNVTLTNATVSDPMLTFVGGPIASLAPAAIDSSTYSATYTLTQLDVDAGQVVNNASVTATPPTGANVTGPATKTTPLPVNSGISLVKSGVLNAGANGVADAGDTITYSFVVKNTGNVTLTNVLVSDPLVAVSGAAITLLPGASDSLTFTGTYTLTQADVNFGARANTATVAGKTPAGPVITAPGSNTTPLAEAPNMALVKAGTLNDGGDGVANVGDTISYVFTVSNTGNVTLSNVKVTDPKLPSLSLNPLCTIATMVPLATNSACTGTYTLTQTDVDAGTVINNAVVDAKSPIGTDVTKPATATTPLASSPAMTLAKVGTLNAGVDGRADVGDTIDYVFTVKNTGNVTLTNVTVADPLVPVSGGPIALLGVGIADSTTFTATYVLTQADVNGGTRANTAVASGNPPTGPPVTTPGSNTTTLAASKGIALTKTGTVITGVDGVANLGDTISYAFRVENTGNVTLTNVVVSDALVTVTGGPIASLSPGAVDTTTYQASYVLTQADIDSGTYANTASVSGNPPTGPPATATGSVTKSIVPVGSISLVKTGVLNDGGDGVANVGDVINYTFAVKNTGNVTLTNVAVSDLNATVTGTAIASLAPGATNTTAYTAVHVLTLADVNAGTVANAASVDGITPAGPNVSAADSVNTSLAPNPSISLLKVGTLNDGGDGVANIGDTIDYVFTVTNTGNVTLSSVAVSDPLVTVAGGPIVTLPPGTVDAVTFTATYSLTSADVNIGQVINNASVKGSPPSGPDVTGPATSTVPLAPLPSLSLVKAGVLNDGGNGRADAGDVINYTFTVKNTGNVTLSNVTLTDPKAAISGGPLASLGAGLSDTTTFTGTHVLTAAEVASGGFNNVATVAGTPPSGPDVSTTGATNVPLAEDPIITLTKLGTLQDGGDGVANIGDTITYAFKVTNTGNVPLSAVSISDPLVGTVTGGPISLAAGSTDTTTFTATYTLTAADIDLGRVDNAASVTGKSPSNTTVTAPANTTNTLPAAPAITLTKIGTANLGANLIADIGETITYAFTVKNTGNVTLTNVTVSDPLVTISGTPITLIAGASDSTHFTATYTLTAADINAGKVDNTASVKGTPPVGGDVTAPASTRTPLAASPGISLAKVGVLNDGGDGVANVGDTIAYTFTVKNTGNVTLTNVIVTDPKVTVAGGPIASLGAGVTDTLTFTASYILTAADVNLGKVDNTALVTATPPFGPDITANGTNTTPLASAPGLTLTKLGTLQDGGDGVANIGDTISYAFTVTNTGNVQLTNVVVTDPKVTIVGGPLGVLVAGASDTTTFTASYVLTAADVDLGRVDNTASAKGKPPVGPDISTPASTSNPLAEKPSIALTKLGIVNFGGDGVANIGDVINYTFTVKNTGNVTLTNVKVTDPKVTVLGGPLASLGAGNSDASTFTATYVLTAVDIDVGNVPNTASVIGTAPSLIDVTSPGPTITLINSSPAMTLKKTGVLNKGPDNIVNAGDVIDYTFVVKNTGNVTLTNVKVTDALVTVIGGPLASLGAGLSDTTTFTASYILTAADVNAGKVDNTAFVAGKPPTGPSLSVPGSTSTILDPLPSITLVKLGTVDDGGDGVANIGDKVMYTFTVTNTGNVTLTNVQLTDLNATVLGGPIVSLIAGAVDSTTFTGTHILTATEINSGNLDNTANVTGTPPVGLAVTAPGSTSTPLTPVPGMTLVKVGTLNDGGDGVANIGDTISYVFTVTNTGNVALSGVTVSDPKVPVVGGPIASLAAGAVDSTTFTAIYTLVAADVNAGKVDNTASATGKTPAGIDVPVSGSTSTPLAPQPQIGLVKASRLNDENGDGFVQVGETVSYSFTVKNSGNVAITNVKVTDPILTVSGGPIASLAAGATDATTFTGTFTITAVEIASGKIINSASVTGDTLTGITVSDVSDSANPADGTLPGDFGSGVGGNDPNTTLLKTNTITATNDNATVIDNTVATPNVLNLFANDLLGTAAATPTNVTLTIDPATPVPAQLTFDPLTGSVGVIAGAAPGTYSFNYKICEVGNPANCATATATVVVQPLATVSGTVYVDLNSNGIFDSSEPKAAGYGVRLVNSAGDIVGTAVTDANGAYSISTPPGAGFSLIFSLPGGGADIGTITNVNVASGANIINQNQPIDPSGVVYDAVTRLPVAGVTVTLVDAAGNPLPAACLGVGQQNQVTTTTGAYRFDILPGADSMCPIGKTVYGLRILNPVGYFPGYATSIAPQAGALNVATCPIDPSIGGSCQVSPSGAQPPVGTAGIYYTTFVIGSGDPDLVYNHLPIQPLPVAPATFSKTAGTSTAKRGEIVTYTLEAKNVAFTPARFVDVMPAGFDFVVGSAMVNGSAVTPTINGSRLTFNGLAADSSGTIKLTLKLVVGSVVVPGQQVNNAQLIDPATGAIIAKALATVEVLPEHVFDCGDIIGKVFEDKNRNGYEDEGELGLPGVRVVTVKGVLITTDKHGRYHVGCADVPDAEIGSNFILKLDTRTLPSGYRVTTENPKTVRLTRGKITKLNFGASIVRVIRLDLTGDMFGADIEVTSKLQAVVQELVAILDPKPSVLRLTYYADGDSKELSKKRLRVVEALVNAEWKKRKGRYKLPIEARLVGVK